MSAGLAGNSPRPHSLGELRIWLAGSARLASALSRTCETSVLRPGDWREYPSGDRRPAFLLVEAGYGVDAEWRGEVDRLLDHCESDAVPRLLWITDADLGPQWLERCRRFDRVFTADRAQLREIEAAGAVEPSILWPAAAAPTRRSRPAGAGGRSVAVAWLGGWQRRWPAGWRERLESVLLGAAGHGLRIVAEDELDDLPPGLRGCVSSAGRAGEARAVLRDAKVVVCADPLVGSPTFAPPVVFDAAGCGAAVITPHEFGTIHDFGTGGIKGPSYQDLVPIVRDGEAAAEEIGRLLGDALRREEVVSHLQRIIDHNHTHQNRLATLASALGYRLIPDALHPTPA